jgi:hypothetical protein
MSEDQKLERFILWILAIISLYFMVSIMFSCSGALPFDGDISLIIEGDDESDDCSRFCLELERLDCAESIGSPGEDETFGTEDDVPCLEVCRELTREPTFNLDRKCLSGLKSCQEIDNCFN